MITGGIKKILIDTNVILASIMQPVSHQDILNHDIATSLLSKVSTGGKQAIVSEVVLHECYYVLVTRDKRMATEEFCSIFRRFLEWPGWVFSGLEKETFLRALEIVEATPKREFSDAVIAARAEANGAELATFDKRLAKAFGGPIWAES